MGVSKEVDAMDRRKKGSGQITHVPGRKSPWRASVVDSAGKQKSRFFKTEKEAKAFLREVNADANKLKALLEKEANERKKIIEESWKKVSEIEKKYRDRRVTKIFCIED